mgnify:FL=1
MNISYKWWIAFCIIFFVFVGVLIWQDRVEDDIDLVPITDKVTTIKEGIHELEDIQNSINQLTELHDLEASYLEMNHENPLEEFISQEQTIYCMIGTAMADNADYFIESFHLETFSKDLFSINNPEKIEVVQSFMEQITRNKTISAVGYKEQQGTFGTSKNIADVVLKYEDGLVVQLEIEFEPTESHKHGDVHDNHSIYVIKTSILDIIENINSAESI